MIVYSSYRDGFEVSSGFIADTLRGKQFLPALPGMTVGPDVAVAPPEAGELLQPIFR